MVVSLKTEVNNVNIDESMASKQILVCAKRLVDLKFEIDTKGRTNPQSIPSDLHGFAHYGDYGPFFGLDFLSSILPFLPREYSGEKRTMNVPTDLILGCSWNKWPDPNISNEEKEEVLTYINSAHGIVDTFYGHIPELGIYFAGEGKNRVNFCRYHKIPHIPAKVMDMRYPEAHRIKIYTLNLAGGQDVWAVLDDRYLQKVSHYAYALPILRAYGVLTLDKWPEDVPKPHEIIARCGALNRRNSVIDLHSVLERIQLEQELEALSRQRSFCSLVQMNFSSWRPFVVATISLLLGLLLLPIIEYHEWLKSLSIMLLSFSSGIVFVLIAPIHKCFRAHIES